MKSFTFLHKAVWDAPSKFFFNLPTRAFGENLVRGTLPLAVNPLMFTFTKHCS